MPAITVRNYCLCGAKLCGTMPLDLANALAEIWAREHVGDGHGKATPQQASRARAKLDWIAAKKEER